MVKNSNQNYLPFISIVTPSYNQGQFIRETIESVLTQSYSNLEYWVIDGGSKDETLSILKEYEQDPRFHWISESDRGQSDAINKGLAKCAGELFTWLNSDDVLLPNSLQHVVAEYQKYPGSSILYGLAKHIDQDGKDLGYCGTQSTNITAKTILLAQSYPAQPAVFMPTWAICELGGVDMSLHYLMDLDLWIKLSQILPFKYITHDIALYRIHKDSKSVALTQGFAADIDHIFQRVIQKKLLPAEKAKSRADLYAARILLTPQVKDLSSAFKRINSAIKHDKSSVGEGFFIAAKGLLRLFIGEYLWSKVLLFRFSTTNQLKAEV